jgi:hypothetical protein
LLLAFVVLLGSAAACAQDEAGVVGGYAFAGRQDLTIERRSSPEGTVMSVTREPDLPVDGGGAWGLTFTHWAAGHSSFGFTIDALYWTSSLEMRGLDPARTPRILRQQRIGLFPAFTGRFRSTPPGGSSCSAESARASWTAVSSAATSGSGPG